MNKDKGDSGMKSIRRMVLVFVFVLLLLIESSSLFFNKSKAAGDENVYDVVLFWGEENMLGPSGDCTSSADSNFETLGLDRFSDRTGIDKAILDPDNYFPEFARMYGYTSVSHVNAPLGSNSNVYEYSYLRDDLVKVIAGTDTFGEGLQVHLDANNQPYFTSNSEGRVCSETNECGYTQRATATIMAPWFGREYTDKTGHKLVFVHVARSGKEIKHFLPHDDNAPDDGITSTNSPYYLYEAMVTKYRAAVNYLESSGYTIGKKFDIVFQGEADAYIAQTRGETSWEDRYQMIHNSLKRDLGLEFSAIVYTARANGTTYQGINLVHQAQENAVRNNDDVIVASAYPYRRYVSNESNYKGTYLDDEMSYSDALNKANLSTAVQCANGLYYNSAALSQIGLEAVDNILSYYDPPMLIEELDDEEIAKNDGWHFVKAIGNNNAYNWAYYENGVEIKRYSRLVSAHKGWHSDVPENSDVAFIKALSNGYLEAETDVRFTKDNVPVLSHDPTLHKAARKKYCTIKNARNDCRIGSISGIKDGFATTDGEEKSGNNDYKMCVTNKNTLENDGDRFIKFHTYDWIADEFVFDISHEIRLTDNASHKTLKPLAEFSEKSITKFEDAVKVAKKYGMHFAFELKDECDEGNAAKANELMRIVYKYNLQGTFTWICDWPYTNLCVELNKNYNDENIVIARTEDASKYGKNPTTEARSLYNRMVNDNHDDDGNPKNKIWIGNVSETSKYGYFNRDGADLPCYMSQTCLIEKKGSGADLSKYIQSTYELPTRKKGNPEISGYNASYDYTGSSIKPQINVKVGNTILTKGKDYEISYDENKNAGTGKITIKELEIGKYVFGTRTVSFTITPRRLNSTDVTAPVSMEYVEGQVLTPEISVNVSNKSLRRDTDYTLTFENQDLSTGNEIIAIVRGINNYTGEVRKTIIVQTNSKKYDVIEGDKSIYTVDKDEETTIEEDKEAEGTKFKIDADYNLFLGKGKVLVDGEEVPKTNYVALEGSTVIIFKKDYMNSLSVGKHDLTVSFSDSGLATATFTVAKVEADVEPSVVPDNNNNSNNETQPATVRRGENPLTTDKLVTYLILLILAIIGLICTLLFRKKIIGKTN